MKCRVKITDHNEQNGATIYSSKNDGRVVMREVPGSVSRYFVFYERKKSNETMSPNKEILLPEILVKLFSRSVNAQTCEISF
jgi:hypothetical protein